LKIQGGPFTEEEVRAAKDDPLFEEKLTVRRWDDLAEDPDAETPPLEASKEMAIRSLIAPRPRTHLQ